jgi:L-ribulose-5-phosphate 4-epimerase
MLLEELRKQIVIFGNQLFDEKLVHDMQGNISIIDRASGLIAITPSAIPYRQRTAEDICVLDLNGKIIQGEKHPTSELALHLTLYRNRNDACSVIHTHPIHASVFAITQEMLPQVLPEVAMGFSGDIPVAQYAPPGTQKVADFACDAMKPDKTACLLANHGLVVVSKNVSEALHMTLAIVDAANMIIMARSMGSKVYLLKDLS